MQASHFIDPLWEVSVSSRCMDSHHKGSVLSNMEMFPHHDAIFISSVNFPVRPTFDLYNAMLTICVEKPPMPGRSSAHPGSVQYGKSSYGNTPSCDANRTTIQRPSKIRYAHLHNSLWSISTYLGCFSQRFLLVCGDLRRSRLTTVCWAIFVLSATQPTETVSHDPRDSPTKIH